VSRGARERATACDKAAAFPCSLSRSGRGLVGPTGEAHARPPLAGLPNDAHYTFKAVEGFDSIQGFGKNTDIYTGGGFMRVDELLGRIIDCNSPRVYTLERVRQAAEPPAAAGAR
jgi:hypothetical protein